MILRRFRWLIAVFTVAVVAFGSVLPAAAAGPVVQTITLDDCGLAADWAAAYAYDLKHHAIMQGDESGFRLDDTVTRAEFVTLVARALGLMPDDGPSYADVQGHWSARYVAAAVKAGILLAEPGALFYPDLPIDRQQAIGSLARLLAGTKLADADVRVLGQFADAGQVGAGQQKAMAYALLTGVIQGRPDKTLNPSGSLTRGEAAKILSLAVPELLPAGTDKLSLVLYNDLHGHLLQDGRKRAGQDVGVERLTTAIAGQLLKNPNTVLIDGGDTFQGTPISNLVSGQSVLEWRNQIGVQIAAIGNHEFDWSVPTLQKLIDGSRQPVLSANIFYEGIGTRPDWAVPTATLKVSGYTIGFIGITTPATKSIVVPTLIEGLEFRAPAPIVNAEAARLRREGADLIVVVAHASADPGKVDPAAIENEVADWMKRVTEPVDVVTGAHSHREAAGYVIDAAGNKVPAIQAGSYGKALGRIDLYIDRATRKVSKAVPVVWEPAQTLAATPWATDLLGKWQAQIKPIESAAVGKIARPLTRNTTPAGEMDLGDFIADGMLTAAPGVQIAIMNGGGVRADLEGDPATGEVTWGHLFTVQPFGNTLVTVDMTGAQLRTLLEQGLDSYVKRVLNQPGGHGPMQVAGITYTWDFAKPSGERVDTATLKLADGTLVDMNTTYKVVVNSFMAAGGDDLVIMKELASRQLDTGVIDLDVAVQYFREKTASGPLTYTLQNRITVTNFPSN